MSSFIDYFIIHKNISYKINSIIDENLFNEGFLFHLSNPNNKTVYLDKSEFILSKYICIKNKLEYVEKELIKKEKEITQLKTQLYENNITLQKQEKEIYQLNKKLGEEKICHWLTKKLCILPKI